MKNLEDMVNTGSRRHLHVLLTTGMIAAGQAVLAESLLAKDVIAQGNATLAADFYTTLKKDAGNVCFSPYGIASSIATVYAGARGQTAREIANTMHFAFPQDELPAAFRESRNALLADNRAGIEIALATSLWCGNSIIPDKRFTDVLLRDYSAPIIRTDFGNPTACTEEVNRWFRQAMRGKLGRVIEPSQIAPLTRAMLCSAIYFKGAWKTPFDISGTELEPFYTGADPPPTVSMMRTESMFRIFQDDELSILQLPYTGGTLSMVLLLPSTTQGLPNLEEHMSGSQIQEWLHQVQQSKPRKTSIRIPRTELTCKLSLAGTLSGMGMPSLFKDGVCDLSGMTLGQSLFLSSFLHQVAIDINETGTEARGATAAAFKARSQPISFVANHPFIFIVVENSTGNILFCGRLLEPTTKP